VSRSVEKCRELVEKCREVSRQCRGSVEVVSIDTGVNGVEVCRPVSTCVDLCQRAD